MLSLRICRGTSQTIFTHEEMLADAFDKIERAVQRKSLFSDRPDYVLVVCFDDFMWFGTEDDRTASSRAPSCGARRLW